MGAGDQQKWDAKYTAGEHATDRPSAVVTALAEFLPRSGRAIDIAGGAGRHAIWLAKHGLEVTIADVSPVGLNLAAARAAAAGVDIATLQIDLEREPFPAGPWDMIFSHHFLWRQLFDFYPHLLAPGGVLVVVQPTVTNLERHEKPPRPFLLDDGELPTLVGDLDIVHYEEGWLAEGRHEAVIVARRPGE